MTTTKKATVAVGNKRLLKLAEFLEKLPRKKFYFGTWATGDLKECGTVGCALGWATQMPEFKRLGLKIFDAYAGTPLPQLNNDYGYYVGAELFGTDYDGTSELFSPEYSGLGLDATPKQVAKHIRKFVKARSKAETATVP